MSKSIHLYDILFKYFVYYFIQKIPVIFSWKTKIAYFCGLYYNMI